MHNKKTKGKLVITATQIYRKTIKFCRPLWQLYTRTKTMLSSFRCQVFVPYIVILSISTLSL